MRYIVCVPGACLMSQIHQYVRAAPGGSFADVRAFRRVQLQVVQAKYGCTAYHYFTVLYKLYIRRFLGLYTTAVHGHGKIAVRIGRYVLHQ